MLQRFQEVTSSQIKSGICTVCSKRRKRTFKVSKTVNPFNRTEQTHEPKALAEVDMSKGRPKTREEVARDCQSELAALVALPFVCAGCAS